MSRIEELEKRLAADPNSRTFVQLAEEYRKAGLLEQAIDVCENGIKIHPQYPSARVALGRALLEAESYERASAEFEAVLRQIPDNILANKFLGETYHRMGRLDEARKKYDIARTLAPEDTDLGERMKALEADIAGGGAPAAGAPAPAPAQAPTVIQPPGPAPVLESTIAEAAPEPVLESTTAEAAPEPDAGPAPIPLAEMPDEPMELMTSDFVSPPSPSSVSEVPEPPAPPTPSVPDALPPVPPPAEPPPPAFAETPVPEPPPPPPPMMPSEPPMVAPEEPPAVVTPELMAPEVPPPPFEPAPPSEAAGEMVFEAANEPAPPPPLAAAPVEDQPEPFPSRISEPPSAPGEDLETPTMAELYASQGHFRQAIDVYRRLVSRQPDEARYRERLEELQILARAASEAPPPATAFADDASRRAVIQRLESWLDVIKRNRRG